MVGLVLLSLVGSATCAQQSNDSGTLALLTVDDPFTMQPPATSINVDALQTDGGRPGVPDARERVYRLAACETERTTHSDWRSFQVRRKAADQLLFRTAQQLHPITVGPGTYWP